VLHYRIPGGVSVIKVRRGQDLVVNWGVVAVAEMWLTVSIFRLVGIVDREGKGQHLEPRGQSILNVLVSALVLVRWLSKLT
jgi:hypothetical protein